MPITKAPIVTLMMLAKMGAAVDRGRGLEFRRVLGILSSPSHQQCVLNQVPCGYATLQIFLPKICLAVQLETKQA